MGHTVNLHNVSRVFFAVDLPFTVEKEGTENCQAHFRLTAQQEQTVREHFQIRGDTPIRFSTSEIAAQGRGWYLAFSLSERNDQALKAILNVKAALWFAENKNLVTQVKRAQEAAKEAQKIVATVKPVRRIVVKKTYDATGRFFYKACDRTLQALGNREGYGIRKFRTEQIRNLMCREDLGLAVSHLKEHFCSA